MSRPKFKMAHMNFLPGGGSGKRIFPEKIKVSPGVFSRRRRAHTIPRPRLYSVRSQKNFLTKKCRCHRDFLKIFKKVYFFLLCFPSRGYKV